MVPALIDKLREDEMNKNKGKNGQNENEEKVTVAPVALREFSDDGFEVVQVGGETKWVDLEQFQEEGAEAGKPCKGNGRMIEGTLMGVQEIEALNTRTKEIEKRFFYNIQLTKPCPVTYKNEDNVDVQEDAQPGDIVALGERSKLAFLHDLATDGGIYQVRIIPHSKIGIGGGQTLWTFNIGKKVLRPAPQRTELVRVVEKAPF